MKKAFDTKVYFRGSRLKNYTFVYIKRKLCFFDYPIFDISSFTVEVDADLGYWLAA